MFYAILTGIQPSYVQWPYCRIIHRRTLSCHYITFIQFQGQRSTFTDGTTIQVINLLKQKGWHQDSSKSPVFKRLLPLDI